VLCRYIGDGHVYHSHHDGASHVPDHTLGQTGVVLLRFLRLAAGEGSPFGWAPGPAPAGAITGPREDATVSFWSLLFGGGVSDSRSLLRGGGGGGSGTDDDDDDDDGRLSAAEAEAKAAARDAAQRAIAKGRAASFRAAHATGQALPRHAYATPLGGSEVKKTGR